MKSRERSFKKANCETSATGALTDISNIEYLQQDSDCIISYRGPINFSTIESILTRLKNNNRFKELNKTTSKRTYSILVECLENITKYALRNQDHDPAAFPYLSVRERNEEIIITSGNPVSKESISSIDKMLNKINQLDKHKLKTLYDEQINREIKADHIGAGLGFILMALRSGNKIDYGFKREKDETYFLELVIQVTENIGRTLIIENIMNAPKVNLDPDRNKFEISGESRPIDVAGFYGKLLKWLDEFSLHLSLAEETHDPVTFDFNFEYFNSLSAKYILDFCKKLARINNEKKIVSVRWYFEEDDLDMLEAGKEISRITQLPFEFIMKN